MCKISGETDTIVALSTALGEAGIHILRLSGPDAYKIINDCFIPNNKKRWFEKNTYTLHLGWFTDRNKKIDQVLVGRMLGPASFTGEDIFEINCHGGILIAQSILETCIRAGAHLAEPGEFTKRAFLNGKLDLVQAEAIIDLISARSSTGADLALSQLNGSLSKEIIGLREQVLEILAYIEAGIDFPEDDVEGLDRFELGKRIKKARDMAQVMIEGSRTGRILREGLMTVIVGRPNVGKSSLLNALVKEERAIVTDIPGTTRDEIREYVNIGGITLLLVDTAGIRESIDPVEKIGIQRSWKSLEKADLILLVIEAGKSLSDDESLIIKKYYDKVIVILNKIDLDPEWSPSEEIMSSCTWIKYSVIKNIGYSELVKEIKDRVFQGKQVNSSEPLISNIRHITALERCDLSLQQAVDAVEQGIPWDIISIDIRKSLEEVSTITGHNVMESLLDDIFTRFCIGK